MSGVSIMDSLGHYWIGIAFLALQLMIPMCFGWGKDGHYATCKIAEVVNPSQVIADFFPSNIEWVISSDG